MLNFPFFVALVVVVIPGVVLAQLDGKPELAAGMELVEPSIPTHLQGPIRDFNEDLSRDVRPRDNSAVYFVEMFGADVFLPNLRDDSLAMMGIKTAPSEGSQQFGIERYVRSTTSDPEDVPAGIQRLQRELSQSCDAPWTASDFPHASKFLDANGKALDAMSQIVGLDDYYVPVISEETPQRIISASFAVEHRLKEISPLFLSRAMRNAGSEKFDDAINDLMVCRRLAVKLANASPIDVSHVKAHSIDALTFVGARQLIENRALPPASAQEFLRQLIESPEMPLAIAAAQQGETVNLKQEVFILKSSDTFVRDYLELGKGKRLANTNELRLKDLDWTLVERRVFEIHNQVIEALQIESHPQQHKVINAINLAFDAWQQKSDELYQPGDDVIDMDKEELSIWVGETIARSFRGNPWQRRASDDRAKVRLALTKIGLALTIMANETRAYPDSLSQLAPKYLESIPNDTHSGKPFTYQRRDDGSATLISWGTNQIDDANQTFNDDLILELPANAPAKESLPRTEDEF